jgi:hypothetical protein
MRGGKRAEEKEKKRTEGKTKGRKDRGEEDNKKKKGRWDN